MLVWDLGEAPSIPQCEPCLISKAEEGCEGCEGWLVDGVVKLNEAVPGGGSSGARFRFISQRLEMEDNKSGGIGGIGDHTIPCLDQWIHPWIHVGRRCHEAENDPHGGGGEGLMPEVVERRGWSPCKKWRYFVEVAGRKKGATVQ